MVRVPSVRVDMVRNRLVPVAEHLDLVWFVARGVVRQPEALGRQLGEWHFHAEGQQQLGRCADMLNRTAEHGLRQPRKTLRQLGYLDVAVERSRPFGEDANTAAVSVADQPA